MSTLGSLVVEVSANVARFQGDMGRVAQVAESAMRNVEARSAMVGSALRTMGGALAAALSIEAMRGFASRTIESTASLKDMSEKTGATVEHLSALRSVASLGGKDIDAVSDALVKMTRGLSGADDETKGAAQGIKALGLNLDAFKRLDSAEQLKALADRLETFRDGAGKTALAVDVLGRGGANLLPYLKDLAEQGALVAKVTAKQAEEADLYEKNLRALAAASDRLKKQLVMDMLPALTEITSAMRVASKESGTLMSWWVGLGGLFAKSTIGQALNVDGSDDARRAVEERTIEIKRLTDAIDANQRLVNSGEQVVAQKAAERIVQIRARLEELQRAGTKANEALKSSIVAAVTPAPQKPELDYASKVPKPNKEPGNREGETFLMQLQRQVEQINRGRFEMLRLEAAQKGVSAAASGYIGKLEKAELHSRTMAEIAERAARVEEERGRIGEYFSAGSSIAKGVQEQTEALTRSSVEQRRATELRKLDEMTIRAIANASQEAVPEVIKLSNAMRTKLVDALDDLEKKEREMAGSADLGIKRAFDSYAQMAANRAQFAENFITGSLTRMEDALVNFVKTGKLSFSDLFGFMAEEFLRNQIRMAVSSMDWGGSLGSIVGGIGKFLGFGQHATGLQRVPYDGYPAILHEGERVLTRSEADGAGRGAVDASISIGAIGDGVSRGQMSAAINQALGKQMLQIRRLLQQDKLR